MIFSSRFRRTIRDYYRAHPRPMPWRQTRDPYLILVSEIMLQQTQVARVMPFYENFIKKFPNLKTLARAKTSDVLRAWQGLGYNRRALALKKLAREVLEKYNGRLPHDREILESLPGIGPYTAGAIRAFAFNEPEIFIETNIRRVFIHFFFSANNKKSKNAKNVTDTAISRCIERTLDRKNLREWYYALMDYGAMLGETVENPNRRSKHYVRQAKFAGSDREIRGKILREMLIKKKIPADTFYKELAKELEQPKTRVSAILQALVREGFLEIRRGIIKTS
jgi:A/G-specific adenine glycosylase